MRPSLALLLLISCSSLGVARCYEELVADGPGEWQLNLSLVRTIYSNYILVLLSAFLAENKGGRRWYVYETTRNTTFVYSSWSLTSVVRTRRSRHETVLKLCIVGCVVFQQGGVQRLVCKCIR